MFEKSSIFLCLCRTAGSDGTFYIEKENNASLPGDSREARLRKAKEVLAGYDDIIQKSKELRQKIADNGDISFYEDTGTTAKLVWKSSDERLGIGTSSPAYKLDVQGTARVTTGVTGTPFIVESGGTAQGNLRFGSGGAEYGLYGAFQG